MSTVVTAKFGVDFTGEFRSTLDLGTTEAQQVAKWVHQFDAGAGAGQADRMFTDARTLAASTSESLDLAAGALTDPTGAVVTFARVRGLLVLAAADNTNNVLVGGAAANGWLGPFADATDIITVRPGGMFAASAIDATAWPVTAGTGDLLKVANSGAGTSVRYTVVLLGASA